MQETKAAAARSIMTHHKVAPPDWQRIFYLFHRLFEAHFLPTHMAILVISTSIFQSLPSLFPAQTTPIPYVPLPLPLTSHLRLFGFSLVALYLALYSPFHAHSLASRIAEMKTARSLSLMHHAGFAHRTAWNWVDFLWVPVVAPVFGCVPAGQAQLSQVWGKELRYVVSGKPVREGNRGRGGEGDAV